MNGRSRAARLRKTAPRQAMKREAAELAEDWANAFT